MTRKQMLELTRRELAHIPDWPQHQRALRMTFWNLRLNSLGKKAEYPDDPLAVVEAAIRMTKADYPRETFEYDRAFFQAESQGRTGSQTSSQP